jgi:hypothetical protein
MSANQGTEFMFWLQEYGYKKKLQGEFKVAQGYVKAALRFIGQKENHFRNLHIDTRECIKNTYNKNTFNTTIVCLAYTRRMIKDVLTILRNGDETEKTVAKAFLVYNVTGARASNILMESHASAKKQVIRINNVVFPKHCGEPPLYLPAFLIFEDEKKHHEPRAHALPYNIKDKKNCAATILRDYIQQRKKEGAKNTEPVFRHPKTKKPLSQNVAMDRIRKAVALAFAKVGLKKGLEALFSIKSSRKAITSHLTDQGRSIPEIAARLGHSSASSQQSYICSLFRKNLELNASIYEGY